MLYLHALIVNTVMLKNIFITAEVFGVQSYLVSSYGVLQMQYSFVSFLVSLEVVVIIFFLFDLAVFSSSYLRL